MFVGLVAVGILALFGSGGRQPRDGVVGAIGPRAPVAALVVAAVATAGSLYYSQIVALHPV